jgi:hypothetical protein
MPRERHGAQHRGPNAPGHRERHKAKVTPRPDAGSWAARAPVGVPEPARLERAFLAALGSRSAHLRLWV